MGAQALVETGMGRVKFKLIDIIFKREGEKNDTKEKEKGIKKKKDKNKNASSRIRSARLN